MDIIKSIGELFGWIFSGQNLAILGAAIAAALAGIGSAKGVGIVGYIAQSRRIVKVFLVCNVHCRRFVNAGKMQVRHQAAKLLPRQRKELER